MAKIDLAPAQGTGGKARERLGTSTPDYTPDQAFAQLLKVRVSDLRRLVNDGTLPVPCRSTEACDWWFTDTVYRIVREVDGGVIWLGVRRHG